MCQTINERKREIISALKEKDLDAWIIPAADPHQSEYLPDHWKIREWATGFTGSAGTAIFTQEKAGLWTDSRYFIQGDEELSGTGIELYRMGEPDVPSQLEFLIHELTAGSKVGMNAQLWSLVTIEQYQQKLEAKGIQLILDEKVIEEIWDRKGRPAPSQEKIFAHPEAFLAQNTSEKLGRIREAMVLHDVQEHLITSLDDIAWIYNLRGYDIAYNPVFLAYTIIRQEDALLFVDQGKLSTEVLQRLQRDHIIVHPYNSIDAYLTKVQSNFLINPEDCNFHLTQVIKRDAIKRGPTLSRLMKACKTEVEINHIEQAMIQDGVALVKAFVTLYQRLSSESMTEYDFAQLIAQKRSEQPHYYGESFPAIVGYQANGAIVHYRPKKATSATIRAEGVLLCDSGGQYYNGTTDITRTIALGEVSDEQKDRYTRVLKGHIAIDQTLFPAGTTGATLDTLARQFLWNSGCNFGHGTGHGVGYFLNVHEPPQGISPGTSLRARTAIQEGMLTSNEPGYYEDGAYGIRIENLIVAEASEYEGYLRHRHLTLFPIDTHLIQFNLMTRDEVKWLNDYHNLVFEKLSPHLEGDELEWLEKSCASI